MDEPWIEDAPADDALPVWDGPDEDVPQDGPGLFGEPCEFGGPEPEPTAPPAEAPAPAATLTRPEAPLALYRRYRPDTFDEVIGQEHVTEPLKRALANNKVNHAYLFSGPRGCGKTTSARILARCLNCETGPTPTPCGVCQSCRDLATGGPGSIDVIELDAATHGLVDDARDLRERAFFAPVQSRYKVYIIDEAHMVTTQGFNALLKLVEEPPPHVKFIFATTEPDKVIGTIRSRTHHYPFRLVPPRTLAAYLATICAEEGVHVAEGVLPLVVRAGAGSVRDALSVLDQLLGAAGEGGVDYASAAALLGYTPEAMLDGIVEAFGARDGKAVFTGIDKVIDIGQDPRRFAADLLGRLRDLIILDAVPDAIGSGLIEASADQADRLRAQASAMGARELARAAEVIATGLTGMRGTTAPRLHLEMMCARVLVGSDGTDAPGLTARLERLERRLGAGAPAVAPETSGHAVPPSSSPGEERAPSGSRRPVVTPGGSRDQVGPPAQQRPATGVPTGGTGGQPSPAAPPSVGPPGAAALPGAEVRPGSASDGRVRRDDPSPERGVPPESHERSSADTRRPAEPAPDAWRQGEPRPAPSPAGPSAPAAPAGAPSLAALRQAWPAVLDAVKHRRRATWILLSQNAEVTDVTDQTVVVALGTAGLRDSFVQGHDALLAEALREVTRLPLRVQAVVGAPDAGARPRPPDAPAGMARDPAPPPGRADAPVPRATAAAPRPGRPVRPSADAPPPEDDVPDPDRDVSLDELGADEAGASAAALLTGLLGAEPIEDLPD